MANILNFTKAVLINIPLPEAGRTEYHDIRVPGLQIRVTQNGVKTFSVYKRVKGGSPQRITLGRFPDMSIEQARVQAAAILSEIASGGNPAEIKRAHKAELTFAELFVIYLERHAKVRKKTADEDEQRYEQYLAKGLGRNKLSSIDRHVISALHDNITSMGRPAVANRVLALISTVFGRGLEWGIVKVNPCIGIRRNREVSRDRFLQSDELPKFFQALELETNVTARDYFWISLLTGARRANVLSMKWAEINLSDAIWRIPETKNGTPQNIPLPLEAIQLLEQRKDQADNTSIYVFPGDGSTGHLVEPFKAWKRILNRAGLEDLRIHDLRRTLGSWQAKTGASLVVIGKSLNHKSTQTTSIYSRLDMDPVRQSMQIATRAMIKAGGNKPNDEFVPELLPIEGGEISANLVALDQPVEVTPVTVADPE